MTAKQSPTGRPETMSVAYKLARFQVGSDPRRRRMYLGFRTAPAAAMAVVFLWALLVMSSLIVSVGIMRILFTASH